MLETLLPTPFFDRVYVRRDASTISDWDWNEPINEDRPYQQQKVMLSNDVSPKKVGFMAIAHTVPLKLAPGAPSRYPRSIQGAS